MAAHEPTRKRPTGGPSGPPRPPARPTREIPDKLYFRIGEVAQLCEVPPYVLRFWEGEFPQLKPNKGGTGQRLYRRRDVEMALRIKTLLYDEGYTIPGARQAFKAELRTTSRDPQPGIPGVAEPFDPKPLLAIQKELRALHALLTNPPAEKSPVQSIRPPKPAPTPKPLNPVVAFPKPKIQPDLTTLFDHLPPDDQA